jgi:hypothetical protein
MENAPTTLPEEIEDEIRGQLTYSQHLRYVLMSSRLLRNSDPFAWITKQLQLTLPDYPVSDAVDMGLQRRAAETFRNLHRSRSEFYTAIYDFIITPARAEPAYNSADSAVVLDNGGVTTRALLILGALENNAVETVPVYGSGPRAIDAHWSFFEPRLDAYIYEYSEWVDTTLLLWSVQLKQWLSGLVTQCIAATVPDNDDLTHQWSGKPQPARFAASCRVHIQTDEVDDDDDDYGTGIFGEAESIEMGAAAIAHSHRVAVLRAAYLHCWRCGDSQLLDPDNATLISLVKQFADVTRQRFPFRTLSEEIVPQWMRDHETPDVLSALAEFNRVGVERLQRTAEAKTGRLGLEALTEYLTRRHEDGQTDDEVASEIDWRFEKV